MEVIIERRKWARGANDNTMKIYDPDTNKLDALGFVLLRVGYVPSSLENLRFPGPLSPDRRHPLVEPCEWMVSRAGATSDLCMDIIHCNDDPCLMDSARESKLREMFYMFSAHRITLKFVDEVPIEITVDNLYKMYRLGLTWEQYQQQMRASESRVVREFLAAEEPVQEALRRQWSENDAELRRRQRAARNRARTPEQIRNLYDNLRVSTDPAAYGQPVFDPHPDHLAFPADPSPTEPVVIIEVNPIDDVFEDWYEGDDPNVD